MGALKEKVLVFFIGLITITVLLETGLRIEGMIYPKKDVSENRISRTRHNQDYVILCIGDSQTFGLGAAYDDSYPRQLERILNENYFKKKFIVINAGVVGSNSSQALKELQKGMEAYFPDLVIALVGVKNENLDDSNYWLFVDKKEVGIKRYYCKRLDYYLSKLRTYRLLKMLKSNLKNKAAAYKIRSLDITKKNPAKKEAKKNRFSELSMIKQSKEKEYIDLGIAYLGQRKLELAMQQAKKALEINPNNEFGHLILASVYRRQQMYDLAKSEIAKAIEINSDISWAYSEFGHIYYAESKIDPVEKEKNIAMAIELFNKAIDVNPTDIESYLVLGDIYFFEQGNADLAMKVVKKVLEFDPTNDEARRRLNIYLQPAVDHRATDKLLEYDLENIIKLAMNRGAAVIILGYPHINAKDEIRREVAARLGIPFIDSYSRFNDLWESHNR
jgi:tetratricopeptide (TPR) repeat protein